MVYLIVAIVAAIISYKVATEIYYETEREFYGNCYFWMVLFCIFIVFGYYVGTLPSERNYFLSYAPLFLSGFLICFLVPLFVAQIFSKIKLRKIAQIKNGGRIKKIWWASFIFLIFSHAAIVAGKFFYVLYFSGVVLILAISVLRIARFSYKKIREAKNV
jgi:hypothetical protein